MKETIIIEEDILTMSMSGPNLDLNSNRLK